MSKQTIHRENQITRQTSAGVNSMNGKVEKHTATVYTLYENPVKQKIDVLLKTHVSLVSVSN